MIRRDLRKPTPAELGLDVTIGLVGVATPDGFFIAVSDQRISYGDIFPPSEKGTTKIQRLTADKRWWAVFAASDIAVVPRLLEKISRGLGPIKDDDELERYDAEKVMEIAGAAYSDVREAEFAAGHLKAIGYPTVEEFRKNGFHELGRDEHAKHMLALAQFDLGVELLIFGYHHNFVPHLFAVNNPGKIVEYNWQGYGAVGSGSFLALGALRQRPTHSNLEDMIYRLLEAKFVSEAAQAVGRTTNLMTLNHDGEVREMPAGEIASIREAWEQTQVQPTPSKAFEVISASRVVKGIADGER
ncbi:MAG: hypothetical protein AB7O44_29590 [Hyphomicrobiaceae bacterium]